jgi:putative ATP-dependent endonuclease of the OLD family
MRITKVRIQNFRSFSDETVVLDPYTCLIGPNGAGKSNVLRALCVFFRNAENSSTEYLVKEDFHQGDTSTPIRITLTFEELTESAKADFAAYVRQGKLVVSAVAEWDASEGKAPIMQFGSRLINPDFAKYFAQDAEGKLLPDLQKTYAELRAKYSDLPDVTQKTKMTPALREHETDNPAQCVERESGDQFYGFSKGANKLRKYLQFVYVPAVKDATVEEVEGKHTAIGELLERAVRSQVSFTDEMESIATQAKQRYDEMLESKNNVLEELSTRLTERIRDWATPDAALTLRWHHDGDEAVDLAKPMARIVAGQGGFHGELARMGHGLQRSFLLAVLQVLASTDDPSAPTLILACEEPELYQHPPQIRHMASVLRDLAQRNGQVLVSTHSPLLVTGRHFENVRLVRRADNGDSTAKRATLSDVSNAIAAAQGAPPVGVSGRMTKLEQSLAPGLSEMFFCERLVLVERSEDRAYILSWMEISGKWEDFRRKGIHVVPAEGKRQMIQPRAVASVLGLPTFTVFDADADAPEDNGRRKQHENENKALLGLCGFTLPAHPWPTSWNSGCVMWNENIGSEVKASVGATTFDQIRQQVLAEIGHDVRNVDKETLYVYRLLEKLEEAGHKPAILDKLCENILEYFA